MKTTVHIISHSHWDREWYQSFESHRMKLIELVDNILDLSLIHISEPTRPY